jgi:hypothetical protein
MIQNLFAHNPLKRLQHPPYFPDMSPSDFCLFGKGKSALIGLDIPGEIDRLGAVTEMLNGTSYTELQRAFRTWI